MAGARHRRICCATLLLLNGRQLYQRKDPLTQDTSRRRHHARPETAQSQGWRRNVGSVTMEEFACNWITYTLLQTHVDVKLSIFHAKAASRIFRARPIESQGIRFGRQKTRNIGECGRPAAFALSIEFRSPLPFVQVRTDPRQRQK